MDFFSFIIFLSDLPGSLLKSIPSGNGALFPKVFPHVYLLGSPVLVVCLPKWAIALKTRERKHCRVRSLNRQLNWNREYLPFVLNISTGKVGGRHRLLKCWLTEGGPPEYPGSKSLGGKEQTDGLYRWGGVESENWVSRQNYRVCFKSQKYYRVSLHLGSAPCQPVVTHTTLYLCARVLAASAHFCLHVYI